MASMFFDRLSAQDSSFLMWEDRKLHMHVGAVAIYDRGPLAMADGGIDIDRLRSFVDARLERLPRYRQRIIASPLTQQPFWVDDESFDLRYHVRHTSLPKPGTEQALKDLAGRIFSQQLDRERPLWEMWFVEGLEGNRFAAISKTHHCMIDGAGGVSLLTTLLSPSAEETVEPPTQWTPRPRPGLFDLLTRELGERAKVPVRLFRAAGDALANPTRAAADLLQGADAVWQAAKAGFHVAADTPINRSVGLHRRLEWRTLDLNVIKALKRRLDGTVNDVVLTITAGALRRLFRGRHQPVSRSAYRAVVPVNVRSGAGDDRYGNRVSAWFLSLPLEEADPLRRYERVRADTERLRASKIADGIDLLSRLADGARSTLLTRMFTRVVSRMRPYNMIITNVPGPQFPLFLLGAPLVEMYPQLPLFENQGLGVAVLSYNGKVCWGLAADWDLVPDLAVLGRHVRESFEELWDAAGMDEDASGGLGFASS